MTNRYIYICSALIVLFIFGCVAYMFGRYNIIAKETLETAASAALGVKVTIGELHINEGQGTARLGHVKIFNPRHYSDGAAVEIGAIDVWIDTWSRDTIKLRQVALDNVQVNLETQPARYNIKSMLDRAQVRKSDADLIDIEKMKVIADSIIITNNRLRPRDTLVPHPVQTVNVPDIKLGPIGYDENGAPVLTALADFWSLVLPEFEKAAQKEGFLQGYVPGRDGQDANEADGPEGSEGGRSIPD